MKRWRTLPRARRMPKGTLQAGYTFVELMIVLAVSGAMLSAVVLSFRGRQGRVEFTQAVRSFEAKLLNLSSDVSKGYYPNGLSCTAPATGNSPPVVSGGAANPGSTDCIFLGKLFASGDQSTSSRTKSTITTLVGRRYMNSSTTDVTTIQQAQVREARNSLRETYGHPFQLEIRSVVRADNTAVSTGIFGFVPELGGGVAAGAGGSGQAVVLYGYPTSSVPFQNNDLNGNRIENNLVPMPGGIIICLRGANNQRAEIRLGQNNIPTSIVTTIDVNTAPCNAA